MPLKTVLEKLFSHNPKSKSPAIGGKQERFGMKMGIKRAEGNPSVKILTSNRISGGTQRIASAKPKTDQHDCSDNEYWDEEQQTCMPIIKEEDVVRFTKMKTATDESPTNENDIEKTIVGKPEIVNEDEDLITKFNVKKGTRKRVQKSKSVFE